MMMRFLTSVGYQSLFSIVLLGLLSSSCSLSEPRAMLNPRAAAKARIRLGLAYLAQGELPLAQQNLEQALQYQPKNSQALRAMAYYQQQAGEPQSAKIYYQQALQQTPRDGQLLHQYADFLCQQRCYPEAQRYFTAALQAPGYTQMAATFQQSGFCYLLAGDTRAAKQKLERALRHHPAQSKEWIRWAHQAVDKAQIQQAAELLTIYHTLQPNTPESLYLQQRIATRLAELPTIQQ